MKGDRSIKTLAKEAKKRLKNGFWETYGDEIRDRAAKNGGDGLEKTRIVDYYQAKVFSLKRSDDKDFFYEKVKKLLDKYGERGNVLSMLIDYSEYNGLSYDAKQKYVLELSEKYRTALERYKREKSLIN